MGWELIRPRPGRSSVSNGVTVAWRYIAAREGNVLAVSLGSELVRDFGLKRGMRLVAKINRDSHQLLLELAQGEGWMPVWRKGKQGLTSAALHLPLDLPLEGQKPAQTVAFTRGIGTLHIKLPAWAVPPALKAAA